MESKQRSLKNKSGKADKAGSGNPSSPGNGTASAAISAPEKKESASKEVPAPLPKKTSGVREVTPSTNPSKHVVVKTENQEASGAAPELDSKADGDKGESTRSFFETMKPLLLAGGVAVAAVAVMLGMAFFARKK